MSRKELAAQSIAIYASAIILYLNRMKIVRNIHMLYYFLLQSTTLMVVYLINETLPIISKLYKHRKYGYSNEFDVPIILNTSAKRNMHSIAIFHSTIPWYQNIMSVNAI